MLAVKQIAALPTFISQEDHKNLVASTPTSFTDIPPVLRYKEDNVSVSLDPELEEFSEQDLKHGTLYVLTSVLVYMSSTGRGFQIEYPVITLHAISRGASGPSIYCQLDESTNTNGTITDENEPDSEMRELSIIPQRVDSLESIFDALSQCAALHPDNATSDDEDEVFLDADGFETFAGTEDEELSEVGRAALAHLESIIHDPHDLMSQFEDTEEAGGGGGSEAGKGDQKSETRIGQVHSMDHESLL